MMPLERLFDDRRPPPPGPREPSFSMSTAQLGMIVLLVSLSVLFAASLVGMLVVRLESTPGRGGSTPGLPPGLAVSTALLAALGIFVERGRRAILRNRWRALSRAFGVALALSLLFLVSQVLNFQHVAVSHARVGAPALHGFSFDLLMGLHALHVIGGLVPLAVVIRRAGRNEYSSSRHEGVSLAVQYWHFLGVVWLILVGALWALG